MLSLASLCCFQLSFQDRDERRKKKTQQQQAKRKFLLEEIDEIKKKKRRVDTDIKSLNETADELCLKAESTWKLTFVTQEANSQPRAKFKN